MKAALRGLERVATAVRLRGPVPRLVATWLLLLVALGGCGRMGYEPRAAGADGAAPIDAADESDSDDLTPASDAPPPAEAGRADAVAAPDLGAPPPDAAIDGIVDAPPVDAWLMGDAPPADAPFAVDARPGSDVSPAAPLDALPPPQPFVVGTFIKSGTAAPLLQVVPHGLGAEPRALFLWTTGAAAAVTSRSLLFGVGASDGPGGTSRAFSAACQDGRTSSLCGRRMGTAVVSLVHPNQTVRAEAEVAAWDETGFTLRWTTNDTAPSAIHYIAFAGAGVSARVVDWEMPIVPGRVTVRNVGFRPDVVLHVYAGAGFASAPPASIQHAGLGLGVMTAGGAQWSNLFLGSNAAPESVVDRAQRSDAAIFTFSPPTVTKRATFVSMDGDGFTLDFPEANEQPSRIFSLALAGVDARAGTVRKTAAAAPADQRVDGLGLAPELLLLTSVAAPPSPTWIADGALALGAATASAQASAAGFERKAAAPTSSFTLSRADRALITVGPAASEAQLGALRPDGFELRWMAGDGVTSEVAFLALRRR